MDTALEVDVVMAEVFWDRLDGRNAHFPTVQRDLLSVCEDDSEIAELLKWLTLELRVAVRSVICDVKCAHRNLTRKIQTYGSQQLVFSG